jgi:hypothetical protein
VTIYKMKSKMLVFQIKIRRKRRRKRVRKKLGRKLEKTKIRGDDEAENMTSRLGFLSFTIVIFSSSFFLNSRFKRISILICKHI